MRLARLLYILFTVLCAAGASLHGYERFKRVETGDPSRPFVILGQGNSAIIYKATDLTTQKPVVLKRSTRQRNPRFDGEFTVLKLLDHPGIPKVLELFKDKGHSVIAMEYMPGITLKTWKDTYNKSNAPRDKIPRIMAQLLSILHHVHSRGVVHIDIHADNILISDEGKVSLVDFGVSASNMTGITGFPGADRNYYFLDPDARLMSGKQFGMSLDYYGAALALQALMLGKDTPNMSWAKAGDSRLFTGDPSADAVIRLLSNRDQKARWNDCYVNAFQTFSSLEFFKDVIGDLQFDTLAGSQSSNIPLAPSSEEKEDSGSGISRTPNSLDPRGTQRQSIVPDEGKRNLEDTKENDQVVSTLKVSPATIAIALFVLGAILLFLYIVFMWLW